MHISSLLIPLALVGILTACGSQSVEISEAEVPTPEVVTLDAEELFTAQAPPDALSVNQARAASVKGQPISINGYIGGRVDPFSQGRGIFTLADRNEIPQCVDHCPTPWDACCEPSEKVVSNIASIRVLGEDGQPIKIGLNGKNGLEPGANISVSGTVNETTENLLVVDVSKIHIVPTE